MRTGTAAALARSSGEVSDTQLVQECLAGSESAWARLVSRYKNLIFSIPLKSGFTQEEASDVFQGVCLDLVNELQRLRDPQALAGWLIRVTHNKCYHLREQNGRYVQDDLAQAEPAADSEQIPENLLRQLEREQHIRTAIAELSPRCRQLVKKLFFESPARPYQEVAQELGLAVGSIGFIRRRCLNKLRQRLEELGAV